MRRFLLASLSACLLLFVAGCGSSGGGSSSGSTAADAAKTSTTSAASTTAGQPPSKPFKPQANAICKVFNADLKRLQARLDKATQAASTGKSFKAYVPVMLATTKAAQVAFYRFVHLNVPQSEEPKAAALARILKTQANIYQLMLNSAQQNDGGSFSAASVGLQQSLPKMLAVQRGLGQTYICGGGKVKPQKGI